MQLEKLIFQNARTLPVEGTAPTKGANFMIGNYQELLKTIAGAPGRTIDDIIKNIIQANAEGRVADAEAVQLDEVARARRSALEDRRAQEAQERQASWRRRVDLAHMRPLFRSEQARQAEYDADRRRSISLNRQATFGMGRPKPMTGRQKRKLLNRARELTRPTEPRKHYGKLTPKFCDVARSAKGLCAVLRRKQRHRRDGDPSARRNTAAVQRL